MNKFTFERVDDPLKVTRDLVDGLQKFLDIRLGEGLRLVTKDQLGDLIERTGPVIVAYDHTETVVSFGRFMGVQAAAPIEFCVETLTMSSAMRPDAHRDLSDRVETVVTGLAKFTAAQKGWVVTVLGSGAH